jgi:HAE1 family hydrophobic/amphiphilic exporter-1
MLAASIIAIFFIPVSFDVVERFGSLFEKKPATNASQPPPEPPLPPESPGRKGAPA